MPLQYREVYGGETRAADTDDGGHEIWAKVCSYGVGPDTYGTTWGQETFEEGLREYLPVACSFHQKHEVVGSVRKYENRSDGLYVGIRMADFDDVPEARKVFSLVRDGHVKGWSFGYDDGEPVPDPKHRGAMYFKRARMYEVSPVVRASVTGTQTLSVRSADGSEQAVDDAQALQDAVVAGVRTALTQAQGQAGSVQIRVEDGKVIIDHEGVREPEDPAELARAAGASLDAASALLEAEDLAALPEGVRQALELYSTVADTTGRLLVSMGIEGERASGDGAKPYGDVEYADPGYQKDKKKRYPIDTADHVRAAWSYINKPANASQYSSDDLDKVKAKIKAAAKKVGVEISDSSRSADEGENENEVEDLIASTAAVFDRAGVGVRSRLA